METAIYCRVSTEEQAAEGFSIRAQEQKLKDYSNVKDWSIFNIYVDEGISGKNLTERPAISRMIEDIRSGHVKNVLVFKLDRLTRSVGDLVYLIDLFKTCRCDFNSLTESIDTSTASGRMFIKIIGIFAEFERENIAERVRMGKERKAREGYTNNSHSKSYGYDRGNGVRIQTINEIEAKNVRIVFDMFVNHNMSYTAIAKYLNMQGIPSKKGSLWNSASIREMLKNCNYIGAIRYSMHDPDRKFVTEGKHTAIISNELFEAAQVLMQKNKKLAPFRRPDEQNYFVNFLYCDECSDKYLPQNVVYHNKKGRAVCYGFMCRKRLLKSGCNAMSVSAGKVEKALIAYFSTYDDVFESDGTAAAHVELDEQKIEQQIQGFKDRLRHYNSREKEIMNNYIGGGIDFDSYRSMKKQIDADREFIKAELVKLVNEATVERSDALVREEIIISFRESWQGLTAKEKRMFLMNYVKKIIVRNDPIEGSRFGDTKVVDVEFGTI